jgi:hypothetical protein
MTKVLEKEAIHNFLGLAGYYHRFIPNFSKIAKPMTKVLEKEARFNWSPQCEEAFLTLKQLITTAPTLAHTTSRSHLMCIVMHPARILEAY